MSNAGRFAINVYSDLSGCVLELTSHNGRDKQTLSIDSHELTDLIYAAGKAMEEANSVRRSKGLPLLERI